MERATVRTQYSDEEHSRSPRRGDRWAGHAGRRLRNEERRDSRERPRGGKGKGVLDARDWRDLLEDGTDEELAAPQGETWE